MPTTSRSTEVAVARPSSTVVLARDGVAAPELYLVRRHAQSSFGDTYAFPGGVVEPADAGVSGFCRGLSIDEANRNLELEDGAIDYYIAAIRELFEESGVLLAGKQPDEPVDAAELTAARDALNGGTLRWDRFVADRQLVLRCDALHYFSFWITPVFFDKRYATRFFLAEMPGDQLASHCGGELTDSCWMTAAQVLDAVRLHDMRIPPPTQRTLEALAAHDSVASMLDWADRYRRQGVPCILPVVVERPDGSRVIEYPDDRDE